MDMNVKKLIFNVSILLSLLLPASAESSYATSKMPIGLRHHADYVGWQRIAPTHAKLQYAGSMGVASVGVGWDYGRQNQWESDVLVGFIPEHYSDAAHMTFTLRQTLTPWNLPLGERTTFEPLSCGVYFNTISGDNFWTREPGKYGGKYYKFTSRVRLHAFVGQRINLKRVAQGWLQGLSLYYEFSVCDLNLISKFTNSKLKFSDIIYFSAGVRLQFLRPH